MQPDTFRNLVEYMRDLRRRNRNNYGARKHAAINTKTKSNADRSERNRSGNAGRGENS